NHVATGCVRFPVLSSMFLTWTSVDTSIESLWLESESKELDCFGIARYRRNWFGDAALRRGNKLIEKQTHKLLAVTADHGFEELPRPIEMSTLANRRPRSRFHAG